MNGNTDPCERIRRRRDSYSARADTLEDSLPELEAEGVRTDAIRARIRRLREQAFAENILYEDCLRHPPETQPTFNLKIVGFELTQAIQFFNFNGKGSPFEINPVTLQAQFEKQNSVPLIARKPTILRVYVDRTILPQYPIPTLLTGIMTYAPVTSIGLL